MFFGYHASVCQTNAVLTENTLSSKRLHRGKTFFPRAFRKFRNIFPNSHFVISKRRGCSVVPFPLLVPGYSPDFTSRFMSLSTAPYSRPAIYDEDIFAIKNTSILQGLCEKRHLLYVKIEAKLWCHGRSWEGTTGHTPQISSISCDFVLL